MNIKPNSFVTVIDMQNDFVLPKGSLYVEGTPEEKDLYGNNEKLVIDIKKFIEEFQVKTGTFNYITTEDSHFSDSVEFNTFPTHCLYGSLGQQYSDRLIDIYNYAKLNIEKGLNSDIYSYSISTSSQFEDHIVQLRKMEIENIYIMGLAYNFCVGESAIAYACQGFNVYIIRKLTRSVPILKSIAKMNYKLQLYGVEVIEKL